MTLFSFRKFTLLTGETVCVSVDHVVSVEEWDDKTSVIRMVKGDRLMIPLPIRDVVEKLECNIDEWD